VASFSALKKLPIMPLTQFALSEQIVSIATAG
jgi:hypothetical protein